MDYQDYNADVLTKQSYERSSYKVNGKYVSRAEALQKYGEMCGKNRILLEMGISTGEPLWGIEESSVDVILYTCRRGKKAIDEACKKSLAMREQSRAFTRPIAQTSHNSSRHNVRAPRSTSRSAFSRNGGSGDDDGDPDSSDDPDLPRPGARAQLPNSLTSHQKQPKLKYQNKRGSRGCWRVSRNTCGTQRERGWVA